MRRRRRRGSGPLRRHQPERPVPERADVHGRAVRLALQRDQPGRILSGGADVHRGRVLRVAVLGRVLPRIDVLRGTDRRRQPVRRPLHDGGDVRCGLLLRCHRRRFGRMGSRRRLRVPPGSSAGPRRCTTDGDCTNGQACAPTLGSDGIPRLPYVCTDPACAPYRQCRGLLGSCPNGYCNLCDSAGRCFCAQVCTSDAMCGGAACRAFGTSRGSCAATQTACTPR